MQANNSPCEAFAGGVAAMPKTASGSSRGWQVPARDTSPCPSQYDKVVSQTVPQIGPYTW